RKERLEAVAESIKTTYKSPVLPLSFDIRNRQEVADAIDSLPEEWRTIDVLVNNAGLALGKDDFDKASLDDWDAMIDTNLKGLAYISHAVVQLMIGKGGGHIINISSIAGKNVY